MKTRFKTLIYTLCCGMMVVAASGQDDCRVQSLFDKSQLTDLEKAVTLYWDWETDQDPARAVELLTNISERNTDNWVAPYWASYILSQMANATTEKNDYLERAQAHFDRARAIFDRQPIASADPYFDGLQSLLYSLKSFRYMKSDNAKYQALAKLANESLNAGIKKDPHNPVLMVLAATSLSSEREIGFKAVIASIALLEKAQDLFAQIEDRSPADITYWNEHWIGHWLKRLSPPEKGPG